MDPVQTFPLPPEPPVDLARLIARTNEAAHGMMPYVEGFYKAVDSGTTQAEALLKKAAQPLIRSLNARTNGAVKRLSTFAQPIADALASGTAAAQRGMLDFPTPTATATSVFWAAIHCPDLRATVIPAEPGSPPEPGDGWRIYGPYRSDAQAQQAIATYRTYLATDASCTQAADTGGGSAPPALDYYWVE